MKYGYARVSTVQQDLESQLQTLANEGCDKIYSEKYTGTKTDRPQFKELLSKIETGDTLVVTKLDRLARSMTQGSDIVKDLLEKGIKVNILNIGMMDNTPTSKLIKNIFFSFAEFERDMIVERTQEGRELARQNPEYKDGRKPKYTKLQLDHAISQLDTQSYNQVADITGISKSTLIREVKRRRANSN
ncbi:recombinase family protein [Viridibacillus sp. FSL E2-0187]|uniref:recombinase family protein n=1 Tax=Viridibacillus sp. FSL E2-0187 TaxID=2921362 RepID=UPI0030FBDE1E